MPCTEIYKSFIIHLPKNWLNDKKYSAKCSNDPTFHPIMNTNGITISIDNMKHPRYIFNTKFKMTSGLYLPKDLSTSPLKFMYDRKFSTSFRKIEEAVYKVNVRWIFRSRLVTQTTKRSYQLQSQKEKSATVMIQILVSRLN